MISAKFCSKNPMFEAETDGTHFKERRILIRALHLINFPAMLRVSVLGRAKEQRDALEGSAMTATLTVGFIGFCADAHTTALNTASLECISSNQQLFFDGTSLFGTQITPAKQRRACISSPSQLFTSSSICASPRARKHPSTLMCATCGKLDAPFCIVGCGPNIVRVRNTTGIRVRTFLSRLKVVVRARCHIHLLVLLKAWKVTG